MGVRSRQLGWCELCAADNGDAGLSDTAEREPGSVGLPAEALRAPDFPPMEDFPLKQSRDDTLRFAFDQVRSVDGHLVRPDAATSHPFFSIIRDYKVIPSVLWHSDRGRSNPIVGSAGKWFSRWRSITL